MFPTSSGGYSFAAPLADEAATYRLMTDVAAIIEPGDVITLSGDLGAGKTTFARALIRYLAGDDTIEVPSPTFTLTQTYSISIGCRDRLSWPNSASMMRRKAR